MGKVYCLYIIDNLNFTTKINSNLDKNQKITPRLGYFSAMPSATYFEILVELMYNFCKFLY